MKSRRNCWEFKQCERGPGGAKVSELGRCPVAEEERCDGLNDGQMAGRICWIVGGTLCGGEVQGTFAHKMASCLECEFYRAVKRDQGDAFESGDGALPLLTGPFQLEQSFERLSRSHTTLKAVSDRLPKGGGELAASVALQINNPLTGILCHAEDLLESAAAGSPEHDDLSVIIREALHCRDVVREMLDELVAQERLAAVGETVAGLAHCMKNATNALRGGQYVIERGTRLEDAAKLDKGLRMVRNGTQLIEDLTFDMLYYSKDRTPSRTPTDPNAIVEEVAGLVQESAARRGVDLEVCLGDGVGAIAVDKTAICRAVLNLATNAVDACEASETGGKVTLSCSAAGNEIVITVADSGTGMSNAVRSKLFTRFFSTKASGGTGLGLLVVKKVTEEHGGTLRVESTEGAGSTFHMHLPVGG